jgi:TM2 domain-containing membrane protein YozV
MFKIIGADGKEYGPISVGQLKQWINERRVNAQTRAFTEGATEWKPLGSFPEFASANQPAPPPLAVPFPPAPPTLSDRASKKIAAGICGILLGCLGIHKFILGYTGPGLVMLLVSVLTCGVGATIFWIIGLIEGIIYLTKSDEEFVRTYIDGRKEWF